MVWVTNQFRNRVILLFPFTAYGSVCLALLFFTNQGLPPSFVLRTRRLRGWKVSSTWLVLKNSTRRHQRLSKCSGLYWKTRILRGIYSCLSFTVWFGSFSVLNITMWSLAIFVFSKQAKHNLRNYGKTLMEAEPEKTTDLLKLLCTDYRSSESKCFCLGV